LTGGQLSETPEQKQLTGCHIFAQRFRKNRITNKIGVFTMTTIGVSHFGVPSVHPKS
jgi:hypothetical protein